jgi:hypothetical protein
VTHHFYAAPGKNTDAAPALSPTLAAFFKNKQKLTYLDIGAIFSSSFFIL